MKETTSCPIPKVEPKEAASTRAETMKKFKGLLRTFWAICSRASRRLWPRSFGRRVYGQVFQDEGQRRVARPVALENAGIWMRLGRAKYGPPTTVGKRESRRRGAHVAYVARNAGGCPEVKNSDRL
jgi:hypothetical protein